MAAPSTTEDRSKTDKNWPEGYPGIATETWLNPKDIKHCIKINKGYQCKVVKGPTEKTDYKYAYIQSPKPPEGDGREGLVPVSCIAIGRRAKIGEEILINIKKPAVPANHSDPTSADNKLYNTFNGLLEQQYIHRDRLPRFDESLVDKLDTPTKRRAVTREILRGVNPQMVAYMDLPNFDLVTIRDRLPAVTKSSTETAVYLFFYWGFDDPQRLPQVYVGYSNKTGVRLEKHQDATDSLTLYPRNNHYLAARAARNSKMVHFCTLDKDTKWAPTTEQNCILLFETYAPGVLDYSNFLVQGGDGNDYVPHDTATVGKWIADKENASILTGIAKGVFQKTGWPGGTTRPSFGAGPGLNWASPFFDTRGEKIQWTRTKVGNCYTYRRPSRAVAQKAASTTLKRVYTMRHIEGAGGLDIFCEMNVGPKVGQDCHIIFEITADGSPHPRAYARLPELFGASHVELANSWAARCEYIDDNQWRGMYLQARMHTFVTGGKALGANPQCNYANYGIGLGVYHFFMQQKVENPLNLKFLDNYHLGFARIRAIEFDHLSQTINMRDVDNCLSLSKNDPRTPFLRPAERSRQLVKREFSALDTQVGGPPRNVAVPGPGGKRKTCDRCFIFAQVLKPGSKGMSCQPTNLRTDSCTECAKINVPCTWSPISVIRDPNNLPKFMKLVWQPADPVVSFPINDPVLKMFDSDT